MLLTQDRKGSRERLRQAIWSGLIALFVTWIGAFSPLDQLTWMGSARMSDFTASGDIVFVSTEADPTNPEFPARRAELAEALQDLRQAGARAVYLDMAFEKRSKPASDRALNQALHAYGSNAFLIRNMASGYANSGDDWKMSIPEVGAGVREVGGDRLYNFMGVVWNMPYRVEHDGVSLLSAATALAGDGKTKTGKFPINYNFTLESIPTFDLAEIARETPAERAERFAGKQIVIGSLASETKFAIPGYIEVPGALIHIYAAETLKSGYIHEIPNVALLLAGLALLLIAAPWRSSFGRLGIYGCIALAGPLLLAVCLQLGIRVSFSGLGVLLFAYSAFRLRARWKKGVLAVDQDTGLPTFAALEADAEVAREHPAIIVARMHRFEEVRQSLPAELHAEYVLRIIDRLNAASPDARIYLGPGHTIAWCVAEDDPTLIKDHLEGLRALFASPLQVGGQHVDVGMTFGVDISPSRDVTRRLANAVAAAERTTETYLPILVAETKSEEELIWNISLQARIDAALAQDEIFLVYQPKICIATGEMVGVEALVRWRDPVRGLIPPDKFIVQCEESGRMGHLTRHVLRQACRAGVATGEHGASFSFSVNISATLIHDRSIVAMVREVLAETGFDPRRLVLEVTETYRISDMELACANLRELTDFGIDISMDDFGVGAASLEALLHLPIAELKIDRLFIDRLGERPKALGIVRSILELGRQLDISVVAEGVEDDATLDLLRGAGCPLAQGFGICRPVPLEEAVLFGDRQGEVNARLSI